MGNARNLGSLLNTSTTIQADDLNIGQLGNRNLIINGNFEVWQRGTSFSSSSVNEYSADRFRTEGFSLNTTISRQAFATGQTDVPGFPTYFCRVATSSTVGSGQYWSFQQRIEVPQVVSQGQTYTLSFWVRATSGTISAGSISYGFSSGLVGFPELTTTWQKVTRTLTFGASQISSGFASVYLVYAPAGKTAFSVDVAQVQLEAGDTATPFEHRSYGQELALCQRYYETSYPLGFYAGTNFGEEYSFQTSKPVAINLIASDDVITSQTIRFAVQKRSSPTVVIYSANDGAAGFTWTYKGTSGTNLNWGANVIYTAPDLWNIGQGLSAVNQANESYFHFTADAEL